jgi:hypothetical protein
VTDHLPSTQVVQDPHSQSPQNAEGVSQGSPFFAEAHGTPLLHAPAHALVTNATIAASRRRNGP